MSNEQPYKPHTQTQSSGLTGDHRTDDQNEPRATHDIHGKPMVGVCGSCQYAGKPGYESLSLGVDQKVLDEMKVVDEQIKKHMKDYGFTHGNCKEHYMQIAMQIPGMTPERLALTQSKVKNANSMPACLLKDDALRHAFMRGLFTKDEIDKAAQQVQQSNQNLTERFKTLAGIKK